MSKFDQFSEFSSRLQRFFRSGPAKLFFAGRRALRPVQRFIVVSALVAVSAIYMPQAMAQTTMATPQRAPSSDEVEFLADTDGLADGHSNGDPSGKVVITLPTGAPLELASVQLRTTLGQSDEARDTPPIPQPKPPPPPKAIPADFSEGILIDISERKLYWVVDRKEARRFSIAVPRQGYRTYYGDSAVGWLRPNPTWTPTPNMRRKNPDLPRSVPPGPNNPLGTKAIGTGWKYIYIHGTNRPDSIGTRASSGCFRMHNADVEWLFEQVERGTPIRVQP